jgi:MoaA/NifB/PqqE/SkfB family radical SAM enzyme
MVKTENYKSFYLSCSKAVQPMVRFRLSLLKYFFQRKKYPLFFLSTSRGGVLKTNVMQKKLKMCKFTRFNSHNYFSLTVPHWPSKPFDNMVASGGMNITAAGTPFKKQIDTVIVGITRRCNYKCVHCYEHYNLSDADSVPLEKWKRAVQELQKAGVSIITLSGGEPMMRYEDLLELIKTADHTLSDFHVHTSGYGVTQEKALELKLAGLHAAGVGLDDVNPSRNDLFRGYKGAYDQAINAIKYFQAAGIFTYVNFCPSKVLIRSGDIHSYMELLKNLNVGFVRWLEPKPCGGYSNESSDDLLSPEDREILKNLYIDLNTGVDYRDYPPVSYEAFSEAPENMGCMMAGNSLLYIDSLGNVEPCVFLPVTFGNIMNEDLSFILGRMKKAVPKPLHVTCPSVQLSQKIRNKNEGGIKLPIPYEQLKEEFSEFLNR